LAIRIRIKSLVILKIVKIIDVGAQIPLLMMVSHHVTV
jgi:hypothetical protein